MIAPARCNLRRDLRVLGFVNDAGFPSSAHVRFPDGLAGKNIEPRGRGFGDLPIRSRFAA
jgi:hypothetical protein